MRCLWSDDSLNCISGLREDGGIGRVCVYSGR